MRIAIFVIWVLMQLGLNVMLCILYEPRGLLLVPLLGIVSANMMAAVAGWELSRGDGGSEP